MADWTDQFAVAGGGQGSPQPTDDTSWMDRLAVGGQAAPAPAAPQPVQGAPYTVRLAVGTARPEDRLATIRSFFPDAQPTPDGGNFTYTDPQTKRPTLYNPRGLDLGDIPSVAREGAEAVGGTVGGVLGAAGGLPGSVAGAAAGTAAAGSGVDMARQLFGLPQSYSAGNVAGDLAAGGVGELGGRAVAAGLKAGAGALIRPGAQETVAAADRAGVPVTAAQVGRGPYASGEAAAASVLPFSTPARAQNRLYDRATELIQGAKPDVPNPPANLAEAGAQAGGVLKQSAKSGYDAFKAARGQLDSDFYAAMPAGVRIRLPGVAQTAADIRNEVARSPGVQGAALQPALQWVDRIEQDVAANRGALPLDVLRRTRTQLGQELETEATTALPPAVQGRMRDLYRSLNSDLRGAAAQVSPQAADALNRQDRLVRAFRGEDLGRESVAGSLDSILKANSDEQAWAAFNAGSGGVERVKNLVANMSEPEKRVVARATFERLTTTPAGNQKGPTQWASSWLAAPRDTKQLLFGNITNVDKLDDLAKVLRAQAEGARFSNRSGTGYELERTSLLSDLMKVAAGASTGTAAGYAGLGDEAITGIVGGYLASAAAYNPRVVRGLVGLAGSSGAPSVPTRAAGQVAGGALDRYLTPPLPSLPAALPAATAPDQGRQPGPTIASLAGLVPGPARGLPSWFAPENR